MKILELRDINGKGRYNAFSEPIEGNYIGFAIGPDSLVDKVAIGNIALTAGRVLPMQVRGMPVIEPVRSLWTHGSIDPQPTSGANQVNTRCQILAYECGDVLPTYVGPRAPVERYATFAAGAGAVRVLRLPFQGRSMAQFGIAMDALPGDSAADTYYVYGVRYMERERLFQRLGAGNDSGSFNVQLGTGTFLYGADAITGEGSEYKATVFYVGGTDNGEVWDELHVYVQTPSVAGHVWGYAFDRASVGAM